MAMPTSSAANTPVVKTLIEVCQAVRRASRHASIRPRKSRISRAACPFSRPRQAKARSAPRSAALEGVDTFPGRRSIAGGQQLDREPNQADRDWQEQLVVCGLAACWPKGGGGDEFDSVGQTEWTRPACVLERCADEAADAHEQPNR